MPRARKDQKRGLKKSKKLDTVKPLLFANCAQGQHYAKLKIS